MPEHEIGHAVENQNYHHQAERKEIDPVFRDKILAEIKNFESEILPVLDAFLQFSGDLTDEDYDTLISIFRDFSFLSYETHSVLCQDSGDPHFGHDLNNIATPLLGSVDMLFSAKNRDKEGIKRNLQRIHKWVLPYIYVLEDLLSRDKDGVIRTDVKGRNMDVKSVLVGVETLREGGVAHRRTKKILRPTEIPDGLIKEDEEVLTVPGVISNALMNMVRNSCKDRINASDIQLFCLRDGNELVFRVIDDGRGMRKQHLTRGYVKHYNETAEDAPFTDELNSGFIFGGGEKNSGTKSTGLGLSGLDKRIASLGGVLRVASKRQFENGETGEQINFTTEVGDKKLAPIKLGDADSTIFEIRLPITKK